MTGWMSATVYLSLYFVCIEEHPVTPATPCTAWLLQNQYRFPFFTLLVCRNFSVTSNVHMKHRSPLHEENVKKSVKGKIVPVLKHHDLSINEGAEVQLHVVQKPFSHSGL
jgi:hypothetical protein